MQIFNTDIPKIRNIIRIFQDIYRAEEHINILTEAYPPNFGKTTRDVKYKVDHFIWKKFRIKNSSPIYMQLDRRFNKILTIKILS